jgi:hypothetical protein
MNEGNVTGGDMAFLGDLARSGPMLNTSITEREMWIGWEREGKKGRKEEREIISVT